MRSTPPIVISATACAHEAALATEARRLAALLRRGDCLRLEGNLGAGKTSFARSVIQTLAGAEIEVASPTFTLLQSYPGFLHTLPATPLPVTLWHADLYRLEDADALEEIGLHELPEQGVLLVEWPEIAAAWLPPNALTIRLSMGEMPDARRLEYAATPNSGWAERLAMLAAA